MSNSEFDKALRKLKTSAELTADTSIILCEFYNDIIYRITEGKGITNKQEINLINKYTSKVLKTVNSNLMFKRGKA